MFDPKKLIYWKNGNPYLKLERTEIIAEGAMQSWCHGELQPIINADGSTVGDTPSSFSDERDFYNPIKFEMYGWYTLESGVYCIPEAIRALREVFVMTEDTKEIYLVTGITPDIMPTMLSLKKWIKAPVPTENMVLAIRVPNSVL
jgi:hypothetical protein